MVAQTCGGEGMGETVEQLQERIERCRICRDEPVGPRLEPEPHPILVLSATARICVAGQAPGTRADRSGIPFSDPSGDRLRAWMGIEPRTFYDRTRIAIVPMGFCFPGLDRQGGDLPPRRECRATWHDEVFDRMPQLELVLLIGAYAQRWHARRAGIRLPEGGVSETVRCWRNAAAPGQPQFVALPHPSWRNNAWLRRNPWFEADRLPELRRLVAALT